MKIRKSTKVYIEIYLGLEAEKPEIVFCKTVFLD